MKRVVSGRRMNGATGGLLRSFVLWIKDRPAAGTPSANPPSLRLPAAFHHTQELVRALEAVRSTEHAYPLPDPPVSSTSRASAGPANDTATGEPSAPERNLSSQPICGASEQASRAAQEVARAVERLIEPEPWQPAKALAEPTDQVRPDWTDHAYPLPDPPVSSTSRASARPANDTATSEPSAPEPTLSSQPICGASEQVSRAAQEVARAVERLIEPEPWQPAKALAEPTDQVRPDHQLSPGHQAPALESQGPVQPRLRIHPLLRASQDTRRPAPVGSPAPTADEPPARTQLLPLTVAPTPIGERFHEPGFPNNSLPQSNPERQPDAPSLATDPALQPKPARQPEAANEAPVLKGLRLQAPTPADAPFFRTIPRRGEDAIAPLERGEKPPADRFAGSQNLPQLYRTPMLEPFSLAEPGPDPAGGSWFGFFSVLYPVLAFAVFAAVKLVLSAHEPGPLRPAPAAVSRTGMQSGDMLSLAPARDGTGAAASAKPVAKLAGAADGTPALAPTRPQAEPDPAEAIAENSKPLPRTASLRAADFAQAADLIEPTSAEVPPAPATVEMSPPKGAVTSPGRDGTTTSSAGVLGTPRAKPAPGVPERAEPSSATASSAAVPDPDPDTAIAREPKAVDGVAPPSTGIPILHSIESAPNTPAAVTPRELLPATGPGALEPPAIRPGDEIAPKVPAQARSDAPEVAGATPAEQGKFAAPPSTGIPILHSIEPAPNTPAAVTPRELLPATGPGALEPPAIRPGDEIAPKVPAQARSDAPEAAGATPAEQGKFAAPKTALAAPADGLPSPDLAATTASDRAIPAEVLPPVLAIDTRSTAATFGAAMITDPRASSAQLAPGDKTPAAVSEPMQADTLQAQPVSKSADLSDAERPTRAADPPPSVAPVPTSIGVALSNGEVKAPDLAGGAPAARRVDLSGAGGSAADRSEPQGASAQPARIAPLRGALSATPKTEKIAPVAMMPPAPSTRSGAGWTEVSRGGVVAPTSPSGSAAAAKSVGTLSAPTTAAGVLRCSESRPSSRKLAPSELANLLKGGREFMQNGNLAAARLMFQRAAEACDKDAAFALGGTYDPNMLQKLGIRPLAASIAMARSWYESAKQLGSEQAAAQLEVLGNADH